MLLGCVESGLNVDGAVGIRGAVDGRYYMWCRYDPMSVFVLEGLSSHLHSNRRTAAVIHCALAKDSGHEPCFIAKAILLPGKERKDVIRQVVVDVFAEPRVTRRADAIDRKRPAQRHRDDVLDARFFFLKAENAAHRLSEFHTFRAAWFVTGPDLTMACFDALAVGTVVMVVVDLAVPRRILQRIGVIRCHFSHEFVSRFVSVD